MTPDYALLAIFVLAMLAGSALWTAGFRTGRRSERKRQAVIGAADQPAVRQRVFREAWDRWVDDPQVQIIQVEPVVEPNVKLLKH